MSVKKKNSSGGGVSRFIREATAQAKLDLASKEAEAAELATVGGEFALDDIVPFRPRIFNILDYIESSWGLGMKLYPVQRFLVKLYYFLPLDDKERNIKVTDMLGQKVLYTFTEQEYLKFLYNDGRCNIGEQDHERRELVLAIGRRGGKSTLSGIFASYEIYRLLNLHNPQQYYGLPNGNRIQIISIAADKEQAGILFNEVTSHLAKCDYFKPHIANNTLSHIQFRTPYDIEKFGPTSRHQNGKFTSFNGKATLRVTFKGSVSRSLRGPGNVVVIMDEMAHYQDKNSKVSKDVAKDVYDAVTPSTAAFSPKAQETGMPMRNRKGEEYPVESRIIAISSPLNKAGKFYDLFNLAMSRGPGSHNMLAIQAPTWEINPTLPAAYYVGKYHADPAVFVTEHGAQFSDRVRGWIEREEDLMACVDETARPQPVGIPRYPHQMGVDVGLMNDGTAIVVTADVGGKITLIYHEVWQAGVDWKKSNPHLGNEYSTDYCKILADVPRLEFDEISEWIYKLTKRFYITDGMFDRWNGIPLEQALLKKGLTQFKSEFFTPDLRSRIYQNAKMAMFDKGLSLYDYPRPAAGEAGAGRRHSDFIQELLTLEAKTRSKNIVEVAAPHGQDYHDDMSDAFTRAVWLTSERMRNQKHVYGALPGMRSVDAGAMTAQRYQMMRARTHGMMSERNPAARHRMVRPRTPRGVR